MELRTIKPKTHKGIEKEMATEEIYPHLNIDLQHLPEAKKWDIKKTYRIVLEVDMVGINMNEDYSDARFEIKKIGVLPMPKSKKVIKRYE